MDWSPNSIDEVQVFPTARIADRNSAQWRQQQQSQRRKSHLQHLARSLESGDLEQAKHALDLLVGDEPEPGQIDITVKPLFLGLGKALLSGDLSAARSAFLQLMPDAHSVRQQHPQVKQSGMRKLPSNPAPSGTTGPSSSEENDSGTSLLDVTA